MDPFAPPPDGRRDGGRPSSRRRAPLVALALALVALLANVSCGLFSPADVFDVSGRLESAFGCTLLTTGDKTYELSSWPGAIPPLDAYVTLRVRMLRGYGSVCMVGTIVQVLRVKEVVTDFRTRPVSGDETWAPGSGPILLGDVEVLPGASLTVLPGTDIRMTPHGELRVRGLLAMVGTAAESIRVSGLVVLDSARTDSRLEFASVRSIVVHGEGGAMEHLTAIGLEVDHGHAVFRQSSSRFTSASQGAVQADGCDLGDVDALEGSVDLATCRLTRLELSYSRADVRRSRFTGGFCYVLYHGASGGVIDDCTFDADSTVIEIRHTSNPEIHFSNFLGPKLTLRTESYELPDCVHAENNWWGAPTEDAIRPHLGPGASICFSPWLTGPALPIGATSDAIE